MAGRTLYDKLWDSHLVTQRDDGSALIYIDRHLLRFATQAFRRPVASAEIEPYAGLARRYTVAGKTTVEALQIAYKAILSSTPFLLRYGAGPACFFSHVMPGASMGTPSSTMLLECPSAAKWSEDVAWSRRGLDTTWDLFSKIARAIVRFAFRLFIVLRFRDDVGTPANSFLFQMG